ncbi:MAG TPA: helix-turn-helix domain-containing protein [Trebonia sp.]|nr:helix-turn-helix domain-containing protein [Trebonia sp.]
MPGRPVDVLEAAAGEIRRVVAGEVEAASVAGPTWWARVVRAAGGHGNPALLVTSRTRLGQDMGSVIADAAALLGLRGSADQRERADAMIRESVLHLLMNGEVGPARQVAGVMKPDLAEMVQVIVVEGPAAARGVVANRLEAAYDGAAWIVRCPVYRHHVIVLLPVDDPEDDSAGEFTRVLRAATAATAAALAVGVGDPVALRDTSVGYEQAYHALAVARHRPERYARYTVAGDMAAAVPDEARLWARKVLAPLLEYEPARERDLDGAQLRMTLQSWLIFREGAASQLKIHPNTLAKRVKRIAAILGRDLSSLDDQAELNLALKMLHRPRPQAAGSPPELGELLRAPAVRDWARTLLAPLEESPAILETVRAWLAAGESAEAAADLLARTSSNPVTGRHVRRRIQHAERMLGRALVGGPSARYDVLLALRVRDGGELDAA